MSESEEPPASDAPETEEEWRERLTPEQYRILRERGTEARFSGELVDRDEDGVYRCAGCGAVLFESETKYDSGCGWPSFYAARDGSVERHADTRHGMRRVEIRCSNCDGHLGHVFEDGPEPTGERFCINSVAMTFEPSESSE
ncbi:peptide-methionine (R)-S-oxide reductase MsrB [Halegenticoccus tardaugens]|uniref:peptide-methionine (R)-S-oxide reductase MsrB n=1 Tax=Halegenticoccus tardaugens TaxID=2071624 RepID=UPI00100B14B9|nr:peptide-methionine (R)-S-oxide reductase MsrB [Halegenticoccus tardaugens]